MLELADQRCKSGSRAASRSGRRTSRQTKYARRTLTKRAPMAIRIPFRIKSENLYKFIQIQAFRVFVQNTFFNGKNIFKVLNYLHLNERRRPMNHKFIKISKLIEMPFPSLDRLREELPARSQLGPPSRRPMMTLRPWSRMFSAWPRP